MPDEETRQLQPTEGLAWSQLGTSCSQTSASQTNNTNNNNNNDDDGSHNRRSSSSFSVMRVLAANRRELDKQQPSRIGFGQVQLQVQSLADPEPAERLYPNNTLLADLSRCHAQLAGASWSRPAGCLGGRRELQSDALPASSLYCVQVDCEAPPRHKKPPDPSEPVDSSPNLNPNQQARPEEPSYPVPACLRNTRLKLKADDYDAALSVLTGDVRFKLHLLLSGRVQTLWLLFTSLLCVLAPLVVLQASGLVALLAATGWLLLQLLGIPLKLKCQAKLDEMLEKSVAQVNSFFVEYNLLLGVINAGSLFGQTRYTIPLLYFDTAQCKGHIESLLGELARNRLEMGRHRRSASQLQGYCSKLSQLPSCKPNLLAFAQSQLAKKIILRFSQRWISNFDKRKLIFKDDQAEARHLSTGKCLCQFFEDQLGLVQPASTTGGGGGSSPSLVGQRAQLEAGAKASPILSKRSDVIGTQQVPPTNQSKPKTVAVAPRRRFSSTSSCSSSGGSSCSTTSNCRSGSDQRPTRDVRLDIEPEPSDVIISGDELLRQLRIYLELKKDELKDFEGSLFSAILCKVSPPLLDCELASDIKTDDSHLTQQLDLAPKHIFKGLDKSKKFFGARDGLLSLGAKQKQDSHFNYNSQRV